MILAMKSLLAIILLCASHTNFTASSSNPVSFKQTSHQINCERGRFEYLLYAPDSGMKPEPRPAIMVLHGAGDHPDSFIEAWKSFARKENVVIIAPELPRKAEFEALAPGVFRCMVKESAALTSLDLSRLYLFGHSMGGYLAYDGAMFDSDLFAAVAVHAMGIEPQYAGIVKQAKRKTPMKIYIGDRDQFVAIDGVRRTRDFLVREGFPVEYQEIKHHDHNYYALADEINADAWRFFSEHRLAEH
jgi:poly(3-hydroxybutyrate) depolymerase